MAGQRIRIRLKAYDHRVIDQSAREIPPDTVKRTGARVAGPIPLPDPDQKNSPSSARPIRTRNPRETFEQRTHKRLLDIIEPTAKTVDELKNLNLPAWAWTSPSKDLIYARIAWKKIGSDARL